MPQESSIPVRGANGLNLYRHSASIEDILSFRDLQSCQNIDLSIEGAVLPRRGLARVTTWNGLTLDVNGDLRTGEVALSTLGTDIVSIIPNIGSISAPPAYLGE